MVSYVASFGISALLSVPAVNRRVNRKVPTYNCQNTGLCLFVQLSFIFGAVLGATNCGLMHLGLSNVMMFGVALLMGISQAVLLISSIAITTEMIGKHTVSRNGLFFIIETLAGLKFVKKD